MVRMIEVDEASSTNTLLSSMASGLPHGTVLTARSQTAGRGQRGNSWEAAPGENITMSILLRPEGMEARRQFAISQCVALGIARVLDRYLPEKVRIKWPNDIYAGDMKICGILIENVLSGAWIGRSVAGIGLNVNQTRFVSDAPNPVSMRMITGRRYDTQALCMEIAATILGLVDSGMDPREEYMGRLWRRHGMHPYRDNIRGVYMKARIMDIDPTGMLTLCDEQGVNRLYAFKEVSVVSAVPLAGELLLDSSSNFS